MRAMAATVDKPKVVADIMTRELITLYEEENLELLLEGMERYGLRHLPVVDGKKLVGLVTHRDLLRAAVSNLEPGAGQRDATTNNRLFVADIMTRDVETVRPDSSIAVAARLLREHRFGCLPVTEADGTLVGIVTEADFVDVAARLLEG